MESEIARWRIAYDTVTALVAADRSRTDPLHQLSQTGSAGGVVATCAAVGDMVPAHHQGDAVRMTQRTDLPMSLWDLSSSDRSRHPTITHSIHPPSAHAHSLSATSLPPSNFPLSVPMTSRAATCGIAVDDPRDPERTVGAGGTLLETQADRQRTGAVELVRDGDTLVSLYRRLVDRFYAEALLWMYTNVLLHPAARRTRNRLHWLGTITGRGLEQAAGNVLTGFVAGYRQSRRVLSMQVEAGLEATGDRRQRARRLAGLAVEVGVVLNPRLMMRSFAAVVRDLVLRTSAQPLLASATQTTAPRLYRFEGHVHESHHSQHNHHHHRHCRQYQQAPHSHVGLHHITSSTSGPPHHHVRHLPPPPPPYPGFLLHFLSVLEDSPVPPVSQSTTAVTVSNSDNLSYEELLRLSEEIGEVKDRGLRLDDVQHLPSYHVSDSQLSNTPVCVICLDQFTTGQLVRALPCCHEYHAKCVDRWLTINRTCPVCRYDIDPQTFQSATIV